MKHKNPINVLMLCALLALLAGCGDDTSRSIASKIDEGPGKPVKNEKQLTGSWYGPAGQEIAGFEFTGDSQVMVTLASRDPLQLGSTMKWSYGLLDGGRLALTQPNGQTRIMTAAISGKTLSIAAENNPNTIARYLKLEDQSIAQAHQQEAQRIVERHQNMLQDAYAFLNKPKLVLVSGDPGLRLSREAFEISGNPEVWSGTAYTEIPVATQRSARVSMRPSSPGQPIVLEIALLDTLGPPGQHAIQPRTELFTVAGEPGNLSITGGGRKLVADAKVFDELVGNYQRIKAERETALNRFLDQFGAYAWLQGGYHYQSVKGPAQQQMAFVLKRVDGQPAFEFVQIHRGTDPDWNLDLKFNAYQQIPVLFNEGKPVLRLPDQTVLAAVEEDGKTVFRGSNRASQDALFSLTEVLTQKEVDARQAMVNDYLLSLGKGKTLRGHIQTSGSNGHIAGRILSVSADPQGNVSGSLKALEYGGTYRLTGKYSPTFLGAAMQLQTTELLNGPYNSMMNGTIRLNLVLDFEKGAAQSPAVHGDLSGGYLSGKLVFNETSSGQLKDERQQLVKLLGGDGGDFTPVQPRSNRGQPTYRIKLDSSSGKISGTISESRNHLLPNGPVTFTGELMEQDGYVYIHLENAAERNAANQSMRPWEHFIWAIPTPDQGMVLAGSTALHRGVNQGKFDPRPLVLLPVGSQVQ